MLLTPYDTQKSGAAFLAARKRALLADEPRVGKTGAALLASQRIGAERTLVVTTKSGGAVWRQAWRDWLGVTDCCISSKGALKKPTPNRNIIISWGSLVSQIDQLAEVQWDLVILDESHYAKNPEAKRSIAALGPTASPDYSPLEGAFGLTPYVWFLTGTPVPNLPPDLYPMLRFSVPDRLSEYGVLAYEDFYARYCRFYNKTMRRGNWSRSLRIGLEAKNTEELSEVLSGFWLRRTQKDVGIQEPIYEVLPLEVTDGQREELSNIWASGGMTATDLLDAADVGETKSLDIHLGPLRRVTGTIKARPLAELICEELDAGTDRIVIMYWHREVRDHFLKSLAKYRPVFIDGSCSAEERRAAQAQFKERSRVAVCQIQAAGEAIDLSNANELVFAEFSFTPKDMKQAALRITNHNQMRQPRVRVAAIAGTLDEALQRSLTRKVQSNRKVI
ncbi:SNF2-related protein [Polycladidibacter hongkongensis]|uniref:SNF2-related protein n=1 Tax=Polycladidibacter hongkongensis TaxID=1647556 RepID=UPI00083732CB|nr:SNF2-related protein [Pseudovibrio hongkongensis]